VKVIDADRVQQTLTMPACIELMADTQAALSRGDIKLPLRNSIEVSGGGQLLIMPGTHPGLNTFGVKLLSLFPGNRQRSKPVIQGYVVLFDADDGTPLALIEAASLTAIRTAAASAMATRLLANESASNLAILGYGVQAASHLEAMCCVRDIRTVKVWGPNPQRCAEFVDRHQITGVTIEASTNVHEAVADADLICAVSSAREPIIEGSSLKAGVHINLVGAHSADAREADGLTLQKARVFTEVQTFALAESGDLLLAIASGHLRIEDIAGEIGEVVMNMISGRQNPEQITLYKSLGNVAQDLAAARYLFDQLN